MNPEYSKIEARFFAKDYEGALALIDFNLAKNPYDVVLHRAKARIFRVTKNLKEAEKWYTAVLTHGFPNFDDYLDRGVNRFDIDDYLGAISDFSVAELINSDDYLLYFKRGGAYWEIQEWEKADSDFNKAIRLNPRSADCLWVSGLVDLQMGRFKSGWRKYEARWNSENFKSNRLVTSKPLWAKDSGFKKVLVWGEQGVGDQILNAGLLPHLKTFVDEVTMLVDPRLVTLLKRSMPDINFLSNADKVPVEDHDCHLPIASLGTNFIKSFSDIKEFMSRRYLKPDQNRVEEIKKQLGRDFIAISWTSLAPRIGAKKSMSLDDLKVITENKDLRFVSVQYVNNSFDEIHLGIKKPEIDCRNDFEGLIALLSLSKCLISVSNSTVHFAGALGVPVLLMEPNKLWYWGNRDENNISYWYPSIKIFPKEKGSETWADAVELVKKDLIGRVLN